MLEYDTVVWFCVLNCGSKRLVCVPAVRETWKAQQAGFVYCDGNGTVQARFILCTEFGQHNYVSFFTKY